MRDPTGCVCLCERLEAGCVPLNELLDVLTKEVPERTFVARVSRLWGRHFPSLKAAITAYGLKRYTRRS